MYYDEVAERGEVASASKSWNSERKEVAVWSRGSHAESAAEADVWRRSNKFGKGEGG